MWRMVALGSERHDVFYAHATRFLCVDLAVFGEHCGRSAVAVRAVSVLSNTSRFGN